MPDDRCEVVLYTPEHDATFWSLGVAGSAQGGRPLGGAHRRRSGRGPTSTTCSCSRTAAPRSAPRSPTRTGRSTPSTSCRSCRSASSSAASRFDEPGDRLVATRGGLARVGAGGADLPLRARRSCPTRRCPTCRRSTTPGATASRRCSSTCSQALDRLFDAQTPYMLWIHQRPFDGGDWPQARLHVEIVTPWRAPGVPRFVAAGELGSGVYFNPVAPEAAAQSLREALSVTRGARVAPLTPAARRSWETPELTSLNRLPPRATLERPPALARSLDGDWEFRLVGAPDEAPAALAQDARLGHGRGPEPLDDARLRHPAVHERRDAVPGSAAARARARTRPGSTAGRFSIPRDWTGRRIVLGFGAHRGGAARRRQRPPGGDREGLPHACRVRRHRRSCAAAAATSSSPSSSAGPTRASSRTRTSGGRRASRAR